MISSSKMPYYITTTLCFLFVLLYLHISKSTMNYTITISYVSPDFYMDKTFYGVPFLILNDIGILMCSKECVDRTLCKAFKYKKLRCCLYEGIILENQLVYKKGSIVGFKTNATENIFGKVSGSCGSGTCPNGQKCIVANNGNHTCVFTECPHIPALPINRTVFEKQRAVGARVAVTCNYREVGSPFTTCKADGTWTPHTSYICYTICTPVAQFSRYTVDSSAVIIGTKLNYTCRPELSLIGTANRLCLPNAYWSPLSYGCMYALSCTHGKMRGLTVFPTLKIDPQGYPSEDTFTVQCKENGDNPWTVIPSTSSEIYINSSTEFDIHGTINIELSYEQSIFRIKKLIEVSTTCRQYVTYRCLNSPIHDLENNFTSTFLKSNGEALDYFPGGEKGLNDCQCNTTSGCSGDNACNCDMSDNEWRLDEGYISYKDDLPLTTFITNKRLDKQLNLTVGSLECLGY